MVSMRNRSSGVGARSANTCPGDTIPTAKTRPSRICLMVVMGLLRAPRVRDKRRRAGLVPTIETCLEKRAGETQVDVRSYGRRENPGTAHPLWDRGSGQGYARPRTETAQRRMTGRKPGPQTRTTRHRAKAAGGFRG